MSKSHYAHSVKEKHQKKFGHYLNEDEKMVVLTGVSHHYLLHEFVHHFAVSFFFLFCIAVIINLIFQVGFVYALLGATVAATIYSTIKVYIINESIQYILTNQRLIIHKGFFNIMLHSANFNKVTYIEVHQNLIERLFLKHGEILVRTAGLETKSLHIKHIEAPIEFKKIMERLIDREKQSYGSSF